MTPISVSVVTPLYNKEPYIERTICSVRKQTEPAWEMIVVENGSKDGGPDCVAKIAKDEPRIRLEVSRRTGPCSARNLGIQCARGKWVMFLDADDLLEPDCLEGMLEAAGKDGAASVIAGCWREFRADAPKESEFRRPIGIDVPNQRELQDCAIAYAPWAVHAAMVRREALTPEFEWPEELDGLPCEDAAFWFQLVTGYRVAYSERSGAVYRTHTQGARHTGRDFSRWFTGVDAAIRWNVAFLGRRGIPVSAGQCETLVREYERLYLQGKGSREGEGALERAAVWLDERWKRDPPCRLGMRLRKQLGLRRFGVLRARLSQLAPAAWRRKIVSDVDG